jgi:hypothetical protein
MRRNVRRLNREVGHIGGREYANETQEEEEVEKYDKENGTYKKVPKSRKAVNLAGQSFVSLTKHFLFLT